MIHELDIYPEYFHPVKQGIKNFEIRRDQGFKVGDILYLKEYCPILETYSGDAVSRRITYIADYRQQPPYVVLGMEETIWKYI